MQDSLLRTIVIGPFWLAIVLVAVADEPAGPPKPKVTIGRETTFITEPLRPDGYPDYVAALNQRMSAGVTPETNAAVLLQKAFGPGDIPAELRANYFRQLGIEPLPESGDYFVTRGEMVKRWRAKHPAKADGDADEEIDSQFDLVMERPWSEKEFPMVAEWLTINEKPLRLAMEASRRPKRYHPIILSTHAPLIGSLLPHDQQIREVAAALATRAMLLAHEGNAAEAWQQLLACHRLARLTATSEPLLVPALVGYAIEGVAIAADASLVHHAQLSAQEIQKMRAELNALPPIADPVEAFDVGERFVFLDAIVCVASEYRGDLIGLINFIKSLSGREQSAPQKQAKRTTVHDDTATAVDWNVPLQMGNQWYDRLVAAARIADPNQRRVALDAYEDDLKKLSASVTNLRSFTLDFFTKRTPQELLSPRVGGIFVALLMPAMQAAVKAHERTELYGRMNDAAFALEAYRADRGKFPERLEALVPKYLVKLPIDTFAEKPAPIRYRREGDAYVLWTVHINGIDEDGRSYDDDPSGDDWVLRPAPVKKLAGK